MSQLNSVTPKWTFWGGSLWSHLFNPPAKNTAAQDAPGTTIVIMDDLRADQSRDADDHVAVMIVDRNATLITAPLVSQCH